jgi:hypothetical protein
VSDSEKTATSLIENDAFLTDMARFSVGILTEAQVKKKYRFDDDTWTRLGDDDPLVEAIESKKIQRERSGLAKRELAQKHVVKAVDVLNTISFRRHEPQAQNRFGQGAGSVSQQRARPDASSRGYRTIYHFN